MDSRKVELIVNDVRKELTVGACKASKLLLEMLEDEDEDCSDMIEIPITGVDDDVMDYVIEWLNYYEQFPNKKIVCKIAPARVRDYCGEWYESYAAKAFGKNDELKFFSKLIMAADYLQIDQLLVLCGEYMKQEVNDKKTTDEVREMFRKDGVIHTLEQEKAARDVNMWIYDLNA